MASNLPIPLKTRLLSTAAVTLCSFVGMAMIVHEPSAPNTTSPAVALAMEIGSYYEGSRLTAYQDSAGVWTVCRGITANVQPNTVYTETQCRQLERAHYLELEQAAQSLYRHWHSYNPYVQASLLDMLFNLGEPQVRRSTHLKLANAGDLIAACQQMTRWVWAVDAQTGQKVQLEGLKNRRQSTAELCQDWGRDGHFSAVVKARGTA